MIPYEIKELCIKSSQKYYDYLLRNNKGLDVIKVRGIKRYSDDQFIFRLEKKIYDVDYIYIKFRDKDVDFRYYKFMEYDRESDQLIVSANSKFLNILNNANKDDIDNLYIISDLKYLVKRVEDWYKANGMLLKYERNPSECSIDPKLLSSNISDEQINALNTIFSTGISYIWGAPGTGKTRNVLARALLNYIKNDCKVLVVAPTNNALEQSLYGIIDVISGENIPKDKILRLGTPSLEFAQKNPECCIEQGVAKRIKELEKTIEQYKEKLEAMQAMVNYTLLKNNLIPAIQELKEMYNEYDNTLERYKIVSMEQAKYEQNLKYEEESRKREEERAKREEEKEHEGESLKEKFMFFFKRRAKKEQDEDSSDTIFEFSSNTEDDKQKILNDYAEKLDKFDKDIRNITYRITEKRQSIENIVKNYSEDKIQQVLNDRDKTEKENLDKTLESINALAKEEEAPYIDKIRFLSENDTPENLMDGYKKAQVELGMMKNNTVGNRISNARIIAATIDCYISNFAFSSSTTTAYETAVDIKHVFLDEAAYCCMIKACTLFAAKCPITLLGDHMQLPPVCEMNDTTLKNAEENKEIVLWSQSAIAIETMFFDNIDTIYDAYINNLPITFNYMQKADLTKTFRFGDALSGVLDRYVYKNGFSSSGDKKTQIILYHVQCNYKDSIRNNIAEATAIANMISCNKYQIENFAILTPYKKQVSSLKKYILKPSDKQQVLTVHASQGKEWDTVILSVVDTAKKWFTDSGNAESNGLKVINTAVSRAKKRLIIVCDANYWINEKEQLIGSLIDIADKKIKYKIVTD